MKRCLSIFAVLCSVISYGGQQIQISLKKDLVSENNLLKHKIDSLQAVIDSLCAVRTPLEDTVAAHVAVEDSIPSATDYSAEVTDSLMNLWYNSRRMNCFSELGDYGLDSVRYTSNVPDSVLIARLADMNAFITLPFNETVKNYMIQYSEKMPVKMRRMLGLGTYYMPIFEEALAKYDLPLELKYMAVIESGLNPTAQSRAGARGMWQFMYQTARSYGLKINSFVDERLDVVKSADAAARYLRDSYKVFGDWNLAISSYNCGPGNVQKAIRRAGSRDFWSIYPFLPRETRGYVPAFVGAMYAMTYYREYGLSPDDVGMPAVTDTFHIRRNLHFRQLDEFAGIPISVVREYNPQYTHDIIPGGKEPSVLRLPYTWSNQFLDADRDSLYIHLADSLLNPQVIKNIEESGQETRIAYRVKSGDYLGRIASRYHVSVKELMKWNHLRSSNLRVGQVIYIYRRGEAPAPAASKSAPAASATPRKAGTSSSSRTAEYTVYTVKSGDTLYGISKQYPGVSANDIMSFNGLGSTSLRPGQKLKIPTSK